MNKKQILAGVLFTSLGVTALAGALSSGLRVGDNVSPFEPTHVTGPDKGTQTCPVCKYGATPAVQVWVNGDSIKNVVPIAKELNAKVEGSKFRAFIVFLIDPKDEAQTTKTLTDIATKNKLQKVAFVVLDKTDRAVSAYKVNTSSQIKNTVIVYKDRRVTQKFVNLHSTKEGLGELQAAVTQVTTG
jgi:protocatechuate 3,4-dioxygenase beta subunit